MTIFKEHADKLLHLTTSATLVMVFAAVMPLYVAMLATLVLGILKELTDEEFDYYDIIFNLIGIMVAWVSLR